MKKKIAVFANGWNGENLENFIDGMKESFPADSVDIFLFMSYAAYSVNEMGRKAENAIYFLPNYKDFDAAVIFGSGINSDEALNKIVSRCREAGIPTVCQGCSVEGFPSIRVNNYSGMKDLCDHLIEVHGVKTVNFIAGPIDNDDSNVRIKAVRDSLGQHGYELRDEDICYANWERVQTNDFIQKRYAGGAMKLPDAIICANDPTSLFVMIALEELGYTVPGDVLVTGFDFLKDCRMYFPSIASVDQCYREQGIECGKLLLDKFILGKAMDNVTVPCSAVPGESCGCINCRNEAEMRKMMGKDVFNKRYWDANIKGRQSLMEWCILISEDYESIPKKFKTDLFSTRGAEGDNFHMLLNPEYGKLAYLETFYPDYDEQFSKVMDVIASKADGKLVDIKKFNRDNLIPGYMGRGKNQVYVFLPLRFEAMDIGYIVMEGRKDYISESKYVEFAGKLNKALEKYQLNIKLMVLNDKLSELMQKDSLTSVKNRIAFDNYVVKVDAEIAKGESKHMSIVMCDINNLKTVNDSFGHDAGDIYIKNCCKLMCETFKRSPIFRIGGDEFVVVISTSDFDVRNELLESMRKKMQELAKSDCSVLTRVSIATGIADLDTTKDTSISDTVKRADAFMYINKAEMKAKALQ